MYKIFVTHETRNPDGYFHLTAIYGPGIDYSSPVEGSDHRFKKFTCQLLGNIDKNDTCYVAVLKPVCRDCRKLLAWEYPNDISVCPHEEIYNLSCPDTIRHQDGWLGNRARGRWRFYFPCQIS